MDTLRDLIDKDILKVSDQTPIEAFSKITDTSFSYIVDETLFKLNIVGNSYSGKEIFERLKYLEDINVVNTREYIRLWTEYVIHELLKIFKFEMKKLGFSRELDVEEKEKMFCNALAGWNYTPHLKSMRYYINR